MRQYITLYLINEYRDYIENNVPYVPIRAFCALCGVMVVPIAYWTLRGYQLSVAASILVALMLCYENGLVTNNRLILLDSILLVFTAFTLMTWVYFRSSR
jgi:dolichyl-phosphate-mannose-protein mannosyltransferase